MDPIESAIKSKEPNLFVQLSKWNGAGNKYQNGKSDGYFEWDRFKGENFLWKNRSSFVECNEHVDSLFIFSGEVLPNRSMGNKLLSSY